MTCQQRSIGRLVLTLLVMWAFIDGTGHADSHNKETILTLGQLTRIGSIQLPPGRYIVRLLDSQSTRDIVQVLDADDRTLVTTVITVPVYLQEPVGETTLRFGEAPAGQPVPWLAWFYPGDTIGREFIDREPPLVNLRASTGFAIRPPIQAARSSIIREKYALVVGVSSFRTAKPDLRFASKDALDVATTLADPDVGRFPNDTSHLRLLRNEQATLAAIRYELADIGRRVNADDLVFLYFSTHGTVYGNLATFDTANEWGGLSLAELFETARFHMNGANVVVVLDACFSGDRDYRSDGAKVLGIARSPLIRKAIPQPLEIVVLASSRSSEESFESERFQNSFFTHYFLQALRASSGYVSLQQLFDLISSSVRAAVLNEKGRELDPDILGDLNMRALQIGAPQRWRSR